MVISASRRAGAYLDPATLAAGADLLNDRNQCLRPGSRAIFQSLAAPAHSPARPPTSYHRMGGRAGAWAGAGRMTITGVAGRGSGPGPLGNIFLGGHGDAGHHLAVEATGVAAQQGHQLAVLVAHGDIVDADPAAAATLARLGGQPLADPRRSDMGDVGGERRGGLVGGARGVVEGGVGQGARQCRG